MSSMPEEGSIVTDADRASETLLGGLTAYPSLDAAHARELVESAIIPAVAVGQNVYTAYDRDELPAYAQWIADKHGDDVFPALVYPMVEPDGTETGQVKPVLGSVSNADGRVLKYVSPRKADGTPPKLPVLRQVPNAKVTLIVEGVKQALAALSWAPEDWSIYRIAGIHSWMVSSDADGEKGTPTPHLAVVQGQRVVIIPDADARTNIHVFAGATALGEACEEYGAKSVKFARLPGGGKDGLDDVLAGLADDDARRSMLASWVRNAKAKPADLDKREQQALWREDRKKRAAAVAFAPREGDELPRIDVGGPALEVTRKLVEMLAERAGGSRVFHRDDALVRIRRSEGRGGQLGPYKASELNRAALRRELLQVCSPYIIDGRGDFKDSAIPDIIVDLVADCWDALPWLSGVTRAPVVLEGGTVLTAPGYDPSSGLYLDLSRELAGIDVPEHPTDADLEEATALLRDDLFAMDGVDGYDGWIFKTEADQTHAVAGLLTPLARTLTSCVPLLLFDGVHRGVGKGGAANAIHQIAFGVPAAFQTTPTSDEEMDKRIAAKLMAGAESVVLDEVQSSDGTSRLESPALGAALTSAIYEARRLGGSEMCSLPNMASWYGTGNNVQVPGDMARRVYVCRLESDRPDLESRDNFRHDLDTWIPENRARLLRACLILIRAWYDRGQPEAPRTFGFKSFTEWQRVIGGVLHLAGFRGFLSTVQEVREKVDSEAVDNAEHWEWVATHFAAGTRFGAADVIARAKADPDAPAPYGKSWSDFDARSLSMYYGTHPRWYGDLRIREDGKLHGRGKAYVVEHLPVGVTVLPTGDPGAPAPAPSTPAGPRPAAGAAPGEVIEFTNRKGFTERVSRAMPPMTGKTIAELGGDAS